MGAGPETNPDLITYKAVKVLQAADVVLYDALVDKSSLEHATDAQQIYVGKRLVNTICHSWKSID